MVPVVSLDDPGGIKTAFADIMRRFGKINGVVHAAILTARETLESLEDFNPDRWLEQMQKKFLNCRSRKATPVISSQFV